MRAPEKLTSTVPAPFRVKDRIIIPLDSYVCIASIPEDLLSFIIEKTRLRRAA